MALCDTCAFMDERYDEFRQAYNDSAPIADKQTPHFCLMYDDSIPNGIYYEDGECKYYQPKEVK